MEEEKRKEIGRDEWKVAFWNVAGLRNKDRDFLKVKKLGHNCVVRDNRWMRKDGIG